MRYFSSSRYNEKGRSMIEMLGVLAIIGVLSVGGLAGYNMAMQKIRINKFLEETVLLYNEVESLYADIQIQKENSLSLTGIDMTSLSDAVKVLGGNASLDSTLTGASNTSSGMAHRFRFRAYGLPKEACLAWASLRMPKMAIGTSSYYCVSDEKNAGTISNLCENSESNYIGIYFYWEACKQ